ncbi:MAG: hypothetical protein GX621_03215 [Pirellulaceae bacterium]|nr:hypothetical protein [Pirellulaceae bacterium]
MSLEISCPTCGKQYKVPESYVGRKAQCKACGSQMAIPAPSPPAEALEELRAPDDFGLLDEMVNDPGAMGTKLKPLTMAARTAGRQEPETPLPATKRRNRSRFEFPEKVARASIPLLIVGALLLFVGRREWKLASLSKEVPQKMTLAQLASDGPGDNIHVELSEFRLLPDLSVVKYTDEGKDFEESTWTYLWIPAVPADRSGQPATNQIKVLVGTKTISGPDKVDEFCGQATLTGLVCNETDSLNREERKLLNEGMQGVDAASCYIFRAGQGPASGTVQFLLLGGGGAAFLVGLVIGGIQLRAKYA